MFAPPRNAVAFLTSCSVFNERRFRRLRTATKGSASGLRELGSARPADVGGFAA
ncbi:MAG: hypothetical protein K2G87_08175 [Oscillospiraceae bacterium]|nr:hypothetical protein [Oscillospiraceae bacterium]